MVCVLNISGGKRLTLLHIGPEHPWGPPSLLYQGQKDAFPYVRQPMHGIQHPPHLAPTLSIRRAILILPIPLRASHCILYLSLYHLLQFNLTIFFFQALVTVWIFNIKKRGINTNTQILHGIKNIHKTYGNLFLFKNQIFPIRNWDWNLSPKIMIYPKMPIVVRSQMSCAHHSTNVDVHQCTRISN